MSKPQGGALADLENFDVRIISLEPFQLDLVLVSHIERPVGAHTFLNAAPGLGQGEAEQIQSTRQHDLSFGSQSFSLVERWPSKR